MDSAEPHFSYGIREFAHYISADTPRFEEHSTEETLSSEVNLISSGNSLEREINEGVKRTSRRYKLLFDNYCLRINGKEQNEWILINRHPFGKGRELPIRIYIGETPERAEEIIKESIRGFRRRPKSLPGIILSGILDELEKETTPNYWIT